MWPRPYAGWVMGDPPAPTIQQILVRHLRELVGMREDLLAESFV